jgi:hypothetical protein
VSSTPVVAVVLFPLKITHSVIVVAVAQLSDWARELKPAQTQTQKISRFIIKALPVAIQVQI